MSWPLPRVEPRFHGCPARILVTVPTTLPPLPVCLGCHIKGRFTHSMTCPCRVHAVLLPCRAAKGSECVFPIWFTQYGRAVPWPWEERRGQSMAWARHDKCKSDTAVLCKSNEKDTFWTLSGTAWQENGMDAACYVWIGLNIPVVCWKTADGQYKCGANGQTERRKCGP